MADRNSKPLADFPMCPNCPEPLELIVADHRTPPWQCFEASCRRGWWNTELSPRARAGWVPHLESHHVQARQAIEFDLSVEMAEAYERGVSVHPDHLHLLRAEQLPVLASLARPGTDFHKRVAAMAADR